MKGGISVKNWENDFAYYEGDKFIMIGNLKEISHETGIEEKNLNIMPQMFINEKTQLV